MFEVIRDVIGMMIYGGWKFLFGDKGKIETLWYGILFVATFV